MGYQTDFIGYPQVRPVLDESERALVDWICGSVFMDRSVTGLRSVGDQDAARADLLGMAPIGWSNCSLCLQLRGNRVRLPDVALVDHEPEGGAIIDPPVLVAEVISPSTQGHDYVTKSHEYATAGIGQYWILDPRQRRLEVFEPVGGEWVSLLMLDDDSPEGTVTVGEYGSVEVDVSALMRRKSDVAEG